MTNDLKLKLDPQALRVLKNLTKALDGVAKALQVNNPQKPKNSELRLTEDLHEQLPGSMQKIHTAP